MDGKTLTKALSPIVSRVRTDVTAIKTPDGEIAWKRQKLTDERLIEHVQGGLARGVCPIKENESVTRLALLDFDSHKGESSWDEMVDAAMRVVDAMEARGMRPIAFRSSGGRGIHLFAIWDEPQDAYSVRMLFCDALAACGFANGTKGVAKGEVEVFPKQDNVPVGGFGSQFFLPLTGKSVPLNIVFGMVAEEREAVLTMEWPVSKPVPVRERSEYALVTTGGAGDVPITVLRSALAAIPIEEHDRDYEWYRDMIFAIHDATGGSEEGCEIAHEFSSRSPYHNGEFLDKKIWQYVRSQGRETKISVRTLFAEARKNDWVENFADYFEDESEAVPAIGSGFAPEKPTPVKKKIVFERDKSGHILATVGNLIKAVDSEDMCQRRIGFDTFRDEIMLASPNADDWRPFTDSDYVWLREQLERNNFRPIGRELIRDVVLAVSKLHEFDTAMIWLSSLRPDGVQRCETFLHKYMGCEDTPYTRAVSLYLWSAMAGRVMQPGVKADMVPILVGAQGAGKSTGVAAMVPSPEFFVEVAFSEKDDDLSRKMRGRLIAEIGELRGLHTKELESIKAFISRTHENWIPKYREFATTFPRRLVFIGTTNQEQFLADETGNRRWLPVEVGDINVDSIRRDANLLWAEAREIFAANGVMWQEAEALGPGAQAAYVITDAWEETVAAWINNRDFFGGEFVTNEVTAVQILVGAFGFDPKHIEKKHEMRLGRVLKQMGIEKRRPRKKDDRKRVYLLPGPTWSNLGPT